ncbi:MAG: SDR family NAD(P)-dependent oxidoreductase [Candidatus Eremiobacteraeota bacterium]|nr:SDR family NAD(P)-dependent oxidoreductase [Candidatus Eremiobacteraeota bacterium]MBC5827511.1 SDR family NAD(P)-dependent oxidoreductase [Candidatus Eremiobacteraeota bacterium]
MNRPISNAVNERWRTRYGPWAVVTGASSGIGRAMAVRLATMGLNLVVVARNRETLETLSNDLRARHEVDVRLIAADLAHDDALDAIARATEDLDVGLLVAAAGFGTSGRFVDAQFEREADVLAVNCRAVLGLSLHFARRLIARGRGGLVLMSSIVAFQGVPYSANYAATKAYIQSLAEALHVELGPLGVDVVASAPGPTGSGFAARADMRMGRTVHPDTVARETLAALGRRATVLPGILSKALTFSLYPLPRFARVRIMGSIMRGMTKHQDKQTAALVSSSET